MTTMCNRLCLAAALTLSLCGPLYGESLQLRLDPEKTLVSFLLPTNTHEVHGRFSLDAGTIRFDPETGSASGEIRVHATGAETGNEKRDRKMHQKALESEKFPYFTFRAQSFTSSSWRSTGDNHVELAGQLEILGREHPATWIGDVAFQDGPGGRLLHGTATLDLPYVEWGLHDPSFLVFRVAKIVHVQLEIDGIVEPAASEADAE